MSTSTALQRTGTNSWLVAPANMAEMFRFCELLSQSAFCPKDMRNKPGDVLAAVQMGAEVGLSAIQALQNICVINGKPSIYGDAMLALCLAHPSVLDIRETWDEATMTATCTVERQRGDRVRTTTQTFSMKDAVAAGLDKKSGPWKEYTKRMIKMRARGFCLRDACADILKGLIAREEAEDIPTEIKATVIESTPVGGVVAPTQTEIDARVAAVQRPDTRPARKIESAPPPSQPARPGVPTIKNSKHAQNGEPLSVLDDEGLINFIRQLMHIELADRDEVTAKKRAGERNVKPKYPTLPAYIAECKAYAATRNITDFSKSKAERTAQLAAAVKGAEHEYSDEMYLCENHGMYGEGTGLDVDIRTWNSVDKLEEYLLWLQKTYNQPTQTGRIACVEQCWKKLIEAEQERAEQAASGKV